jgi:hypothetical protein
MAKSGREKVNKDVARHRSELSKKTLKADYRLFVAAAARCEDAVEKDRYCVLAETTLKHLTGVKLAKAK